MSLGKHNRAAQKRQHVSTLGCQVAIGPPQLMLKLKVCQIAQAAHDYLCIVDARTINRQPIIRNDRNIGEMAQRLLVLAAIFRLG